MLFERHLELQKVSNLCFTGKNNKNLLMKVEQTTSRNFLLFFPVKHKYIYIILINGFEIFSENLKENLFQIYIGCSFSHLSGVDKFEGPPTEKITFGNLCSFFQNKNK
ncbi:unnamed protein product [Musa textilis]